MSDTLVSSAVKGKRGFHPCGYETFLELKEFHKLLLRGYRQFRAYQRWAGKKGSNRFAQSRDKMGNRVGEKQPLSRPNYPEFVTRVVSCHKLGWGGEGDTTPIYLTTAPEFATYRSPESNLGVHLYEHVLSEYRRARYPAATAEEVDPLNLPENWRQTLDELREHFSKS